jgi:hypothetical protein
MKHLTPSLPSALKPITMTAAVLSLSVAGYANAQTNTAVSTPEVVYAGANPNDVKPNTLRQALDTLERLSYAAGEGMVGRVDPAKLAQALEDVKIAKALADAEAAQATKAVEVPSKTTP